MPYKFTHSQKHAKMEITFAPKSVNILMRDTISEEMVSLTVSPEVFKIIADQVFSTYGTKCYGINQERWERKPFNV